MRTRIRALAGSGAAALAALVVAGCGTTGSSSTSSAVKVNGNTLTIYISEPHDLASAPAAQDIVHAEELAFAAQHKQVTDYRLVLVRERGRTLSSNARTAILDPTAIAYLGEVAPGASDQTVGITNALDLLQVSPTDNALELTSVTPVISGSPKSYFEAASTYGRTFASMVPSAALEASAQVKEMKALGVHSLYVGNDGSDYGRALAHALSADAHNGGLSPAATLSGADGIFYAAQSPTAAAKFFNHAASVAPHAKLFGPSSLNVGAFTAALSSAVKNLYVSMPGDLPSHLPAAGRAFVSKFRTRYGHTPNVEAIFGYETMSALLRVLEHAGKAANNRTTVVADFMTQKPTSSVLGGYRINSGGNITLKTFTFARLRGGRLEPFTAVSAS